MFIRFKQKQQSLIKQKGAVLAITLVILVLITLISVSELNQAGQQIKMVNNSQQRNLTFQAAESALLQMTKTLTQYMLSGGEIIDGAVITEPNNSLSTDNMSVSVTYRVEIINDFNANINSGMSLNANENIPQIKQVNFVITSIAHIPSSGVKSVLEQGVIYE